MMTSALKALHPCYLHSHDLIVLHTDLIRAFIQSQWSAGFSESLITQKLSGKKCIKKIQKVLPLCAYSE